MTNEEARKNVEAGMMKKAVCTKRKSRMKGRLVWLLGIASLVLVYWWVMADFVVENFWDPQYAVRYERLKANLAKRPGRPLWLVLGTSHVDNGLRPSALPEEIREGKGPLFFNFGLGGGDMFREMMCLKRLLKSGIKPQRLVLEVNPMLMLGESGYVRMRHLITRARGSELAECASYTSNPWRMRGYWLFSRLYPFCTYGMAMKDQTLPWRLAPWPGMKKHEYNLHDEWGWNPDNDKVRDVDFYFSEIKKARMPSPYVFDTFALSPRNERALREIIGICRDNQIELEFLRMPISSDYAALYSKQANEEFSRQVGGIERESGIREIDARDWVESEWFSDGKHLTGTGAEKFTRRFVAEEMGGTERLKD